MDFPKCRRRSVWEGLPCERTVTVDRPNSSGHDSRRRESFYTQHSFGQVVCFCLGLLPRFRECWWTDTDEYKFKLVLIILLRLLFRGSGTRTESRVEGSKGTVRVRVSNCDYDSLYSNCCCEEENLEPLQDRISTHTCASSFLLLLRLPLPLLSLLLFSPTPPSSRLVLSLLLL